MLCGCCDLVVVCAFGYSVLGGLGFCGRVVLSVYGVAFE